MNRDDCYGTCDISIILPTKLIVLDYKHGRGHIVEANGNMQTLLYAIGALAALSPEERVKITEIETGIIQPRAEHPEGPVRTITYPIKVVYDWLFYFSDRANATDNPDATYTPGEAQCRWCNGKPKCTALRDKSLEVFNAVDLVQMEHKVLRNVEELTIEEQNLIDDMGDIVNAFIEAVRGYKLQQMKAGVTYPGYKLVRGKQGNRRFTETDEEKTIRYLNSAFGLKKDAVTAPRKLLGPAKIVAMAKKSEKANDKKLKVL